MSKYPKIVKSKATVEMRPGLRVCSVCNKQFKPKEYFTIEETQVSWFRGDDEVRAYHYAGECHG